VVELAEWSGLVRSRTDGYNELAMVAPVTVAGGSWSGPFRAIANDGHDYFVKSLDTTPAGEEASLASEFVVAEVGRLIGAPVCYTSLITIPAELSGWEPRPGTTLHAGIAHATAR
jgi:hypothetical protein